MTQVKLWQIVSQTINGIVFSDSNGNLVTLPQGQPGQVLVINTQGIPEWVANTALSTALEAKTDVTNALAAARAYTEAQIAALVDNAPVALNTLNELAVKLNGEDSAINALLLQVDGKAEKTEVVTQVAQAKQDAIQTAQGYTDNAIGNVQNNMDSLVAGIRGDMISYADQTANFRAQNAKSEAIGEANSYTDQAISQLSTTASDDATAKADSAKAAAVSESNAYTDSAINNLANSLSGEAQGLSDGAQAAAIAAADADAAQKVGALKASIPQDFVVAGQSVGCFVAASAGLAPTEAAEQGLVVAEHFTEITGASVSANDPEVNAKLLFVNGIAMGSDWTAGRTPDGRLLVKFSPQLAQRVFDGSQNALMLLVEYRRDNAIVIKTSQD